MLELLDRQQKLTANYSNVGPYMGALWPSHLRGSGMGLVYGVGKLGKFIGPAGLALIAGSPNYVAPKATLDALIPAFDYFAFWYAFCYKRAPQRWPPGALIAC